MLLLVDLFAAQLIDDTSKFSVFFFLLLLLLGNDGTRCDAQNAYSLHCLCSFVAREKDEVERKSALHSGRPESKGKKKEVSLTVFPSGSDRNKRWDTPSCWYLFFLRTLSKNNNNKYINKMKAIETVGASDGVPPFSLVMCVYGSERVLRLFSFLLSCANTPKWIE